MRAEHINQDQVGDIVANIATCYQTRSHGWFQPMLVCAPANLPPGFESNINYVHEKAEQLCSEGFRPSSHT